MRVRILGSLLCLACFAHAQGVNPFDSFAGELSRMPAPDWMKEGTRIQWQVMTGSIPQQVFNAQTGQMETKAPASDGVLSVDIVSLVGNTAGVAIRNQVKGQFMYGGEALASPSDSGLVIQAGAASEFWVHPTVLKKAFDTLPQGGMWIAHHGPHEAAGRQVAAYQFTTGGGKNDLSRRSLVYAEKSGVLLFEMSSQRRNVQEQFYAQSVYKFLALRDRKLPWSEGRPPSWLAKIAAYEFKGSVISEMEGMAPTPIGIRVVLTPEKVGANFVLFKIRQQMDMAGAAGGGADAGSVVSGPTQVGGLWLPPLDLKKLRQGQVCDRDPVTGATVVVQYVGGTQYGRNVVSLAEDAPGYALFMDYEIQTGMLLLSTRKDKLLQTSTQVYFTGKQRAQAAPGGD